MANIPEEYFTGDARRKWDMLALSIAHRLRRLRATKGVTVNTAVLETGITKKRFLDMESTRPGSAVQITFSLMNLYKIALYYNVSLQYLLGDEDITGLTNTMYRRFRSLPMEAQTTVSALIDNLYNITLPANRVMIEIPPKDSIQTP